VDVNLASNTFYDVTPAAFKALGEPVRAAIARDNWFLSPHATRSAPRRSRGGQNGRASQP
jgi:hypothetical protein